MKEIDDATPRAELPFPSLSKLQLLKIDMLI